MFVSRVGAGDTSLICPIDSSSSRFETQDWVNADNSLSTE